MLDTRKQFVHLLSYANVRGYGLTRRNLLGLIGPHAPDWFLFYAKKYKRT